MRAVTDITLACTVRVRLLTVLYLSRDPVSTDDGTIRFATATRLCLLPPLATDPRPKVCYQPELMPVD
jgi:hypothetical protein